MMVLAIALLGLASTTGYVLRMVGGGTQQTIAAQVAQARMEWMRSVPCGQIAQDSITTTRGVREHWLRVSTVNSVVWATDTLTYSVGGREKTKVFTMTVPCA